MPIEKITCPKCGHVFRTRIYSSVNLTEEPSKLRQIINGKFNVSTCPKCKTKIKHTSHVLVTRLKPEPKWVWLVSKKHQSPIYKEQFLKTIMPSYSANVIDQEVVFVDFGKPEEGLKFILADEKPKNEKDWTNYGKLLSGEEAINCFKKALMINSSYKEAKQLLNDELDKLKTYS